MTVIVAVPSPTPRTNPEGNTTATVASLVDQPGVVPSTRWPLASNSSAAMASESPSWIVSAAGATTTESANCTTVTAAVPAASPALAVIVAVPPPTAVSRPAESTTATSVSALDQDTGAPSITRPI